MRLEHSFVSRNWDTFCKVLIIHHMYRIEPSIADTFSVHYKGTENLVPDPLSGSESLKVWWPPLFLDLFFLLYIHASFIHSLLYIR